LIGGSIDAKTINSINDTSTILGRIFICFILVEKRSIIF